MTSLKEHVKDGSVLKFAYKTFEKKHFGRLMYDVTKATKDVAVTSETPNQKLLKIPFSRDISKFHNEDENNWIKLIGSLIGEPIFANLQPSKAALERMIGSARNDLNCIISVSYDIWFQKYDFGKYSRHTYKH